MAQKQQIVAVEIHRKQHHKHGGHNLNVGAEGGERIVFDAEAAERQISNYPWDQ